MPSRYFILCFVMRGSSSMVVCRKFVLSGGLSVCVVHRFSSFEA